MQTERVPAHFAGAGEEGVSATADPFDDFYNIVGRKRFNRNFFNHASASFSYSGIKTIWDIYPFSYEIYTTVVEEDQIHIILSTCISVSVFSGRGCAITKFSNN